MRPFSDTGSQLLGFIQADISDQTLHLDTPAKRHISTADCSSSGPHWPHVPTADSNHSPKLVNATITASIQYCERIASSPLR